MKVVTEYRPYILLALRLAVGVVFLIHGLGKFGIMTGATFHETVDNFARHGIPFPNVAAPMLAVFEFLGGLALIFGVATRVFAFLLAIVVTAEILIIKLPESIDPIVQGGYVVEVLLLLSLLVIAWVGPGAHALDEEPQHL